MKGLQILLSKKRIFSVVKFVKLLKILREKVEKVDPFKLESNSELGVVTKCKVPVALSRVQNQGEALRFLKTTKRQIASVGSIEAYLPLKPKSRERALVPRVGVVFLIAWEPDSCLNLRPSLYIPIYLGESENSRVDLLL